MISTKVVICTFVFFVSQNLLASADNIRDNDIKRSFAKSCDSGYSLTCLKLDMVSLVDKITDTEKIDIVSGVSVVKDPSENDTKTSEIVAELSRNFPNDPEKRLDGYLVARMTNFLQTHTLRLRLMETSVAEENGRATDDFSGRKGKIGKKGGLEGIMAAAMMMKGTLMAVALGALALLAGKALMTGLMALMLSAIIGLKSLTSGGKHTTYEIVAKPSYSHTNSHSAAHEEVHGHSGYGASSGGGGMSGGYGRSLNFQLPEHLNKA